MIRIQIRDQTILIRNPNQHQMAIILKVCRTELKDGDVELSSRGQRLCFLSCLF